MVRVDVAGQPPSGPPAGPAPGPHDMYCSPYGEFYSQEHFFVPPPEMCHQPPHLCTMHGDYGPLMQMSGAQGALGLPVQMVMDECGQVRPMILSPQPPPPPHHMQHTPPHHMQPPPHPTHPQQHYGPANGGPSSGPQQYYGPPGFPPPAPPPPNGPPPHYHPGHPLHSHPHPHGPPLAPPPSHHHAMPPPHSPPQSYHKDERAQRQHVKLKKKFEQKQMRNEGLGLNSGYSTPALSPRKEFTNGVKSRSLGGGGGSMMGGTSSEGEGSSSAATSVQGEDEEDSQPLLDYLSSLQTPQVSEVTARSALVQWSPPIQDPNLPQHTTELRYELLLGDKGKYKAIYSGPSLSCKVQDLRPGTEYSVCLQAHAEGVTGAASGAAVVRTPPCEPGTPPPPRTAQRTRSSLQLRWHAPQDNGSPIQHYILQYVQGTGGEFVDLCKQRSKQHNLQRLEESTCYRFRLAAVNEVGRSQWSDEVAFWTCGSPPPPPAPPVLVQAFTNALMLRWTQRPGDEEFTLQVEDERNRHGYIAAYSGRGTEARCEGLLRCSDYKFRLQAHNDEGGSRFSEEVIFRTLAENPSPPIKLGVKGKIHAHSFRVRWEPPGDRGGTDIQYYTLEIKSSNGEYEPVYCGPDQEATCDRLQPGQTYRLRVSCTTTGGTSGWSEVHTVSTESVVPGTCPPPCLASQPRPNSICLKWSKPDYDGGSPILEYNLEINDEETSRIVYKGKETECTVQELLPGRPYSFRLRAFNKIGGSPWSAPFVAVSGAAPPESPLPPRAVAKSPFSVSVQWDEPPCNGSSISEYKLEMSEKTDDSFCLIYQGSQHNYEVRSLLPYTLYYFRVCAANNAGQSEWSALQSVSTPAAVPASPLTLRVEAAAMFATLFWQEPEDNGSPISHYRIDIGDKMLLTEGPVLQYHLDELSPASIYKVRVQAVNEIGIGNFSPTLKFDTLPLPPKPPQLECVQQSHNCLKLKWGDGKNLEQYEYLIEMQSPRRKDYQNVYRGTSLSFRVKKLLECTKYKFRICAISEAGGQGDFSEPEEFATTPAPPAPMKSLKVMDITESTAHLDWSHQKMFTEEPLTFIVQCSRTKDYNKEVYRGTSTSTTIDNLDSNSEYSVRVCAERYVDGAALQGLWSPAIVFTTHSVDAPAGQSPTPTNVTSTMANGTRRSARRVTHTPMTDHQWAALSIAGLIAVAVIVAIALQHFIDWPKSV